LVNRQQLGWLPPPSPLSATRHPGRARALAAARAPRPAQTRGAAYTRATPLVCQQVSSAARPELAPPKDTEPVYDGAGWLRFAGRAEYAFGADISTPS